MTEKVLTGNLSLVRFEQLFRSYEHANAMGQHTTEEVMCAAMTVVVRAVAQECNTPFQAMLLFDDLVGRAKQQLANSYRSGDIKRYPDRPGMTPEIERVISMGLEK